jgi:heme-degrading monooxygenase HmoA
MTVAASLGANAQAQPTTGAGYATGSVVVVIVKVPKPWYAPRFVVVGKMRDTIPQYQALPGLAFKAFSFAQVDGNYGGIYLWKDLASARAWFAPAWFARVEQERGAPADVRFFEVLAAIDNTPGGTPADPDSSSVATLSTWPVPVGAAKSSLSQQFQSGLEADRRLPGLLRRYFVATDHGRYGHISLWRDKASARSVSDGGKPGAAQSPGAEPVVEWFDTPILLPSVLPDNQPRVPGL